MPHAQTIEYDGISISTTSLEGLMLTKHTLRGNDVLDRSIERALGVIRASRHTTDFDRVG